MYGNNGEDVVNGSVKVTTTGAIQMGDVSPELYITDNYVSADGQFMIGNTYTVGSATKMSILSHASDTGELLEIYKPGPVKVFEIENDGHCKITGTLDVTGDLAFKVATTNTVDFYAAADSVSSGTGTVKMGISNAANSAGWILVKVGGASKYIPFWTTSSPSP